MRSATFFMLSMSRSMPGRGLPGTSATPISRAREAACAVPAPSARAAASRQGRRTRCLIGAVPSGVAGQGADFDAALLQRAARILRQGPRGPEAGRLESPGIDAVVVHEVGAHRARAPLGERLVVLRIAGGARVAGDQEARVRKRGGIERGS